MVRTVALPFWCRTIPKIIVSVIITMIFKIQSDSKYIEWFHDLANLKLGDYLYLGFCILGIGLCFVVRQASIDAQINPHNYDKSIKIGTVHKINMQTPIILNILMYTWILFIPAFPFFEILVQGRK